MPIMIKNMLKNWLIFLCLMAMPCVYAASQLELVGDLSQLAGEAKESNRMLIVLVSQPDCTFCEYVKSSHIEPMMRKGTLANIAIVRELDLSGISLTDFSGESISPGQLARRYNAEFSPSVLFLSASGEQLHEAIIGVSSRDYYGYYLDKAIEKSTVFLND